MAIVTTIITVEIQSRTEPTGFTLAVTVITYAQGKSNG
jgi:hypothetical protein